jgi:hypothetical protein
MSQVSHVAKALQTDSADLYDNLLNPMVKVGQDFISEVHHFLDHGDNGEVKSKVVPVLN